MRRQRSQKGAATDNLVKKALEGIKDGIYKSPYDAAKQLNLNRRTLNYRVAGKTKPRAEAHEAFNSRKGCT